MRALAALALLLFVACVEPEDNPTRVHDLRVLGVKMDAPELLSPSCQLGPEAIAAFSVPVTYTALIEDPAGEGRKLQYEVLACAWPGDAECKTPEDRVRLLPLGDGPLAEADSGELRLTLTPGTSYLAGRQQFLLQQVFEQDTYKGLGGLRMPIVLHVRAGEEEIYASKLFVFNCQRFPEQTVNAQPVLPGLTLGGEPWAEADRRQLQGAGPFDISPEDFAGLQEPYVVPSFSLSPVQLVEAWKVSWYTDYGRMSTWETGGTDLGGGEGRHLVQWLPPVDAAERDFQIWAVVRDGRGGLSWLNRKGHYTP